MRRFDFIVLLLLSIFAGVTTVGFALMDSPFSMISTMLMLFVCGMCACGAYEEYLELKEGGKDEDH